MNQPSIPDRWYVNVCTNYRFKRLFQS